MGYTHYYTQRRNFSAAEWIKLCDDIKLILKEAQHNQGVALANGNGDGGTSPEFTTMHIAFNGVGDDAHETLWINRRIPAATDEDKRYDMNPAALFCKTAEKPYDVAVTAVLSYLATVTRKEDPATHEPIIGSEAFFVSSDGKGGDWIAGVELVRKAIPAVANQVDIPMQIMQTDRWCAPWVRVDASNPYDVKFCVDGKGYVIERKTGAAYCFPSHIEMARFLDSFKKATFQTGGTTSWGGYGKIEPDIWSASGSFDKARVKRIGKAQTKALSALFPVPAEFASQPPAYVRPGEMPEDAGRPFCYRIEDLFKLAEKAA